MKPKYTLRSFLLGCSSLLAASSLHAASLYWDGSTLNLNGASDGTAGIWGTDPWDDGTTPGGVAWNNGNNDTAVFAGTADTVTLGENVTVGGLTFTTSGYSIAPGVGPYTITLGTAGSTTNSTSGSIYTSSGSTTTISADIDNGGFLLSRVGPGNATLSGAISGAGGLTTVYGGTTTLSGNNTYTGKTSISANTTSGSSMSVSSFNSVDIDDLDPLLPLASSSLGAPTTVANGTIDLSTGGKRASCTLTYTGPGESTDRVVQINFNSSSSQTINASGSGLLKFTSAMTSNATSQTGKLFLGGTGAGEIVQGLPAVATGGLQKQNAGTWTLGGTSSVNATAVTGGTLILDGTLNTTNTVAVSSTATLTVNGSLGFGATTISNTATVDGSGTLVFDIDGTTSDLIDVNGGTLDISALAVEIVPGGVSGLTESEYVLVDATGVGYTGTFTGFAGTAPVGYELNYDTTDQVKLVSTGGPSDPFADWSVLDGATGVTFDGDANGDGVQDGLAFLLGAANPNIDANAADLLPTVTETGGGLVLTFSCLNDASNGDNTLNVQYSSDLGVIDTWTAVLVPDSTPDPQATDVSFTVTPNAGDADLNDVVATISSAEADGGKLFGRLQAVKP